MDSDPSLSKLIHSKAETVEEHLEHKEERDELYSAIKNLSPRQREAVQMYYMQEMDYKNITKRMGITSEVARALVSRGIKKLRSIMKAEPGEEGR